MIKRKYLQTAILSLIVLISGCIGFSKSSQKASSNNWRPDGVIESAEYQYSFSTEGLSVFFRVENSTLYVGISSETHGWVAIGFGGGPGMKNTDIVIAYVLPNGSVEISDSYSTGFSGPHNPDTFLGGNDDILSYGGREDENGTVIEFSRPLITGDKYDYPIPIGRPFRVIWAYGPTDDFQSMHIKAGQVYVTLEGEG
ncbi:DOMON domain-containing protein [Thermococcus stetteri]|uniref:DOMON domain-containing protein n=1 Tax=Thermococcus stetteri TaxID=49900 RepID=UPI001AE3BB39|nr:DOMON domain-containing protein [Thermococcus stetteri]MBP1912030.1 hypothetical protein [Thermococcus stetteri]